MDSNVGLPLLSAVLAIVFAILVADQWLRRHHAYQLVWTLGLLWFAIGAGSEFIGEAWGWSEGLYRAWYLTGAILVAAWLGLGTVYLLARTRFGFAFAFSVLLAGLFTFLTEARYRYPGAGGAPLIYLGVAILAAAVITGLSIRRDDRWATVAAALVAGGSLVATVMVLTVHLPAPGYAIDLGTRIPIGELFPGYLRLLTPFFNITGAFALAFGALYSAYVFMPKRRVIRYSLRDRSPSALLRNAPLVPIAVVVNFVASLPGTARALVAGRLSSRVPATILIAVGAFIPSVTTGLNRFGSTSAFYIGQLLGLIFIFVGFLVSIEVFSDLRLPFTRIVLARRDGQQRDVVDTGGRPA